MRARCEVENTALKVELLRMLARTVKRTVRNYTTDIRMANHLRPRLSGPVYVYSMLKLPVLPEPDPWKEPLATEGANVAGFRLLVVPPAAMDGSLAR